MKNEEGAERKGRETHLDRLRIVLGGDAQVIRAQHRVSRTSQATWCCCTLHASSGVGPSARTRCWTDLLELRSRGCLAAPVTQSANEGEMKEDLIHACFASERLSRLERVVCRPPCTIESDDAPAH
jgi:hypothetical protein